MATTLALAWVACTDPLGVQLIRLGAGLVRVPPPGVSVCLSRRDTRPVLLSWEQGRLARLSDPREQGRGMSLCVGVGGGRYLHL